MGVVFHQPSSQTDEMPSLPEYITEDCLLEHLSTTITTMMISQEGFALFVVL